MSVTEDKRDDMEGADGAADESPQRPVFPADPDPKASEFLDIEGPDTTRRMLNRGVAKLIDFLIAGALFSFPTVIGPVAAVTYLLIADGLSGGRSLGKRVVGLRVISTARESAPADFRESIYRNGFFGAIVAACYLLGWIPFVSMITNLLFILVVFYEALAVYKDAEGIRFGDRIAETMVVDSSKE